jgi:xylulose-5-phosphate/fructose-6-phosphate phosphoketolase
LIVACVVGDGEAETGPLAASWHSSRFLNPLRDGVVLPILHLNGYKIANPTIMGRMTDEELTHLFLGYGWNPFFVDCGDGVDHFAAHHRMGHVLSNCLDLIKEIKNKAQTDKELVFRPWPMIVFRSPKGWTGPVSIAGKKCEGFWRSHQVPIAEVRTIPENMHLLEQWMQSYKPLELFDRSTGKLLERFMALAPTGNLRMSAIPHSNGGMLTKDLLMPDFRQYAVKVPIPGVVIEEATRNAGKFLRDVMKLNLERKNFRIFGPDETASNRFTPILDVSKRTWLLPIEKFDEGLSADGRVMEILSEHVNYFCFFMLFILFNYCSDM